MSLIRNILNALLPRECKYYPGEAVLFNGRKQIMVVDRIKRKGKTFIIECLWFDETRRKTVSDMFNESDLNPLDWYGYNSEVAIDRSNRNERVA
jgi:uncharacterized protein YodC (DUF2158 family)